MVNADAGSTSTKMLPHATNYVVFSSRLDLLSLILGTHSMDFSSKELIGMVAVVCIFGGWIIVAIARSISKAWSDIRTREGELELKHRLLDAGMSADEIERVVNAGGESKAKSGAKQK